MMNKEIDAGAGGAVVVVVLDVVVVVEVTVVVDVVVVLTGILLVVDGNVVVLVVESDTTDVVGVDVELDEPELSTLTTGGGVVVVDAITKVPTRRDNRDETNGFGQVLVAFHINCRVESRTQIGMMPFVVFRAAFEVPDGQVPDVANRSVFGLEIQNLALDVGAQVLRFSAFAHVCDFVVAKTYPDLLTQNRDMTDALSAP